MNSVSVWGNGGKIARKRKEKGQASALASVQPPLPLNKGKMGGESVKKLHREFKLIKEFKLTARFLHKMFTCSLFLSAIIIYFFKTRVPV